MGRVERKHKKDRKRDEKEWTKYTRDKESWPFFKIWLKRNYRDNELRRQKNE